MFRAELIDEDYLELNYTVTDDLLTIQNPFFLVQVYVQSVFEKTAWWGLWTLLGFVYSLAELVRPKKKKKRILFSA